MICGWPVPAAAINSFNLLVASTDETVKPAAVSPLMQFGRNSMVAGLTAGALAGALGSVSTILVDSALDEQGETVAFVAFIGILLGGLLLSLQSIIGGNWSAAFRRFLLGAAVGGAASLLALPVASAAVLGVAQETECGGCGSPPLEVPFIANVLIFVIVGSFIGFALGMLRSVKTAIGGLVAGHWGGAVGGAIFGATVAKYDDRAELDVYFLKPATILVVALVGGAIGLTFGAMVRARRVATLTIIEGRNSGMEIAVEGKQATIGSLPSCDVVLNGDSAVIDRHAVVLLDEVPPALVPVGATEGPVTVAV